MFGLGPRTKNRRKQTEHRWPLPDINWRTFGMSVGSVTAVCQRAGAYLLYWSPDQGFHADDVFRGPAAIASVTFEGPVSEVVMRVSCKSGSPVARLSRDD